MLLLYETIIYGNIDFIKLDNFDLDYFEKIIKNTFIKGYRNLGKNWEWRFFLNIKKICSKIIKKKDVIKLINICKIINNQSKEIPINFLLEEIYFLSNKFKLSEYFFKEFGNINKKYSYNPSIPNEPWSPLWVIYNEDKEEYLKGIDIFNDRIFMHTYIKFNRYLIDDIKLLNERINFLKINAKIYYNKFIKNKIPILTKHIFKTFPYRIIYDDYINLIKNNEDIVFIPEIIKNHLDNKDLWLLTILPDNVRSYLLGFPIISSGIPTIKNIKECFLKISKIGLNTYYKELYYKNKQIINLKLMNINCANAIDEEDEIIDLLHFKLKEYNMDDILIIYSFGVSYLFSLKEIEKLLVCKINPYNKQKIKDNCIKIVKEKLKYKKKIERDLMIRDLNISLYDTLGENFKTIEKELNSKEGWKEKEERIILQPFFSLNLFLNN